MRVVTEALVSKERCDQNIPDKFQEAIPCSERCNRVDAMHEEIAAMDKNDAWELVPLPKTKPCTDTKWVFDLKQDENQISKYNARLIAKDYTQQPGVDCFDIFSPVS